MTETVCALTMPGLVFGPGACREAGWRACAPLPIDGSLLERVFRDSL